MGSLVVVFYFLAQVYVLQSYAATESSAAAITRYSLQHEQRGRPTNLFVTSTDVVISIGNSLYFYNSTLYPLRNFTSGRTRAANISRVAVVDGDSLLVCLYDGSCYLLIAYDQDHNEYVSISNVATRNTMISLSVIDETFYVASAGYNTEETPIRLSQFENRFMYFPNDVLSVRMRITNTNFKSREFYHNYFHDSYVYFIAMDTLTTSQERKIMLVRICHQVNESNLHDMFEIELSCGPLDTNDNIASFSKLNETVVLGLSNTAGRNKFCAFNTSDVNRGITNIYDRCLNGGYQFQLPWHGVTSTCTNFNRVIS